MVGFKKRKLTTFVKHLILWFSQTLGKPLRVLFFLLSPTILFEEAATFQARFLFRKEFPIKDCKCQDRLPPLRKYWFWHSFDWVPADHVRDVKSIRFFFSVIRLNNTLCSFSLVQERRWGKLIEPPINFFQTCLSNGTETETFEDKNALFLRHTGLEKPRHYRWVPDHAKEYKAPAPIHRFSDVFFLEYIACTLMSCQVWEVLTKEKLRCKMKLLAKRKPS